MHSLFSLFLFLSMSWLTKLSMSFNYSTTFSLFPSFVARSNSFIKLLKSLPSLYSLNSLSSMCPIYSSKIISFSSFFYLLLFWDCFLYFLHLHCYHYLETYFVFHFHLLMTVMFCHFPFPFPFHFYLWMTLVFCWLKLYLINH